MDRKLRQAWRFTVNIKCTIFMVPNFDFRLMEKRWDVEVDCCKAIYDRKSPLFSNMFLLIQTVNKFGHNSMFLFKYFSQFLLFASTEECSSNKYLNVKSVTKVSLETNIGNIISYWLFSRKLLHKLEKSKIPLHLNYKEFM